MNNDINYRAALCQSLAKNSAGLDKSQREIFLERFDHLSATYGAEEAFSKILDAYGNESPENCLTAYASAINVTPILSKVGAIIQENLKEIAKNTVDKNPVSRVRRSIANFNKNILKMKNGCTVTNANGTFFVLDDDELRALQIQTEKTNADNAQRYTAWGAYRDKFLN